MTDATGMVLFGGAVGLVALGIAGLVLSNHLYRMVLALAIAEAGANLLLVLAGYRSGAIAPIVTGQLGAPMVDPVPQALVLTAIVIGVGVQALAISLIVRVRNAYGTLDMHEVRLRMEADLADAADIGPPSSQERPAGERHLPPPAGQPTAEAGR